MAVMKRKKKAIARGWEAINKQRDEKVKRLREEDENKEDKITPKEHEKRLKLLRDLGLLK